MSEREEKHELLEEAEQLFFEEQNKGIERKDPKGVTDKIISRVVSRKLLVWATATYALFGGVLDSESWTAVALVYIGSQALADVAATWKHGKE